MEEGDWDSEDEEGDCNDEEGGQRITSFPTTSPFRLSNFPRVPPYYRFLPPNVPYSPAVPQELGLPWLVPPATSPTIHASISHSAGNLTEGKVRERTADAVGMIWDMLPITEKTKDEIDFSKVPEGAKINQFPCVYMLGRKDCLWKNYLKMRESHGPEHFDFLPHTYVLPEDTEEL